MGREFGFFYRELLLTLNRYLPAILVGSAFIIVILLVILITTKIVDRSWIKQPEKLEKAMKMKIRIYVEEIKRLKRHNLNLLYKNKDLRRLLKSASSLLTGVENVDKR